MSKTVAICSSRKANPQPQQEILLLDATGWFKGESKRRSRQKRRHAALGRHRKVESDATATAGVCALRHSRGLQFFASKSGHRFDPDHIHQPMRGRLARALRCSLLEGIQDGHVEVREITFVPSGHGEAVNASCGGHHGVLA